MMSSGSSTSKEGNVPLFIEESYNLLYLMMKMMFRLKDLWNIMEKGFNEEEDGNWLHDNIKKGTKALYLIQ